MSFRTSRGAAMLHCVIVAEVKSGQIAYAIVATVAAPGTSETSFRFLL